MKYDSCTIELLEQIGFSHDFTFKSEDVDFTVMKNGYVDVTVCHKTKTIQYDVNTQHSSLKVQSFDTLQSLLKIVNHEPKKNSKTDSN